MMPGRGVGWEGRLWLVGWHLFTLLSSQLSDLRGFIAGRERLEVGSARLSPGIAIGGGVALNEALDAEPFTDLPVVVNGLPGDPEGFGEQGQLGAEVNGLEDEEHRAECAWSRKDNIFL